MSDFSFRPAAPDDAPLIVALLRELADYEKLQPVFHLDEAAVRRDMMGAACRCELAFAGDAPAGITSWYWTYKSFRAARGLFVEDLYVRPDFRGQGLGRRMLARLAGEALAVGGFLEWQVLGWNEPAITFYKSLGAVEQPHWLNYRLQDAALKELAET
ncbi:MAG TPA: GNAT family N-acetyltransferase [Rhizomicrobium sp.]|nr:GNAT family N-acetyltransferase [Rhizomicrobium sp.]